MDTMQIAEDRMQTMQRTGCRPCRGQDFNYRQERQEKSYDGTRMVQVEIGSVNSRQEKGKTRETVQKN